MKSKMQTHISRIWSVMIVTSMLVSILSMVLPTPALAAGVIGTITHSGFFPRAIALDETRNRLFVFASGHVFFYDATTFQEIGSVTTSLGDSLSMVVDKSEGKLYVGYFGSGVTINEGIAVIDIPSVTLTTYLPSGGYTYLVNDEDLDVVYASSNMGITQIGVTSDSQTQIAGIIGNLYTSMAVNPVTHELFVANWSQNNGNLFIVDPTTLDTTAIPEMNGFGVAVNWTENKVYVSYCQPAGWEAVCILDRDTNTKTPIHTGNDSTQPLVFNPSVNRLYSNTEVNAIATIMDGAADTFTNIPLTGGLATVGVRYSTDNVYLIDESGTYVMKGSTGEIVAEFPTGGSCSVCTGAVVINQTSGMVYIINETSLGSVTIVQDGIFLPTAFNKSSPANGITDQTTSPTLNWERSTGASSYEYCYDTSNDNDCSNWISNGNSTGKALSGLETGATYYWQVRAINSDGVAYADSGPTAFWSFSTKPVPPGPFNKSSPANNAINQPINPTLSWGASTNATFYEYCYDTSGNDACDSDWTSTGTIKSADFAGLAYNTTYYWQVRATNTDGTTYANSGDWWSFSTQNAPPSNDDFNNAITVIAPYSDTQNVAYATTAVDDPLTCSFNQQKYMTVWYKYTPSANGELTVSTTGSDYSTILAIWTGTRGNLQSLGCDQFGYDVTVDVTAGATYFIEVANFFSSVLYGETLNIAVSQVDLPGAFNKTAPANGATNQPLNPTILWGTSTGATSYEYCYDTTNDNACSTWINNGASTSKSLSGLASNTTYYWHVRAINAVGATYSNSSASTFWSFKTKTQTLTFPSASGQDGWILESSETSAVGGTMNSSATTFRLGDDVAKKQYRSILSFNTSALPDTAVITKVTLKVKQQAIIGGGNPVTTFQGFIVDMRKGTFGTSALQVADWQANANKTYGPFTPALTGGWYTFNLTSAKAYINKLATGSGLTQIRLRFKLDDNNNAVANYLSLYSGNAGAASRPQLIIEYYVP
ncbi:MAG: DNRLRE domain-containing protein [Chloroflexi bacterium]|nr:DNRLRE domain-containing protein [Chloroflexota bacterium]